MQPFFYYTSARSTRKISPIASNRSTEHADDEKKSENVSHLRISDENISLAPIDGISMSYFTECANDEWESNALKEGEVYSTNEDDVEGFNLDTIYFRLIKVADKYKDNAIDCMVVKEVHFDDKGNIVDGNPHSKRRRYFMSKAMCNNFGIKYELGLELWNSKGSYTHVRLDGNNGAVNPNDLSTYPHSSVDCSIKKILIGIYGCEQKGAVNVVTPNKRTTSIASFLKGIKIQCKEGIVGMRGYTGFDKGDTFRFTVLRGDELLTNDSEGRPMLLIAVSMTSEKGLGFGVSPISLKNLSVNDIFEITENF